MRILVLGAGGVGSAVPAIAQRRGFFDHLAIADVDVDRARRAVDGLGEPDRFSAHAVDASDQGAIVDLIGSTRADVVLNAVDPVFNLPIFHAAFEPA